MRITIIGTGYVGLVSGTCFAEMGHIVTCVDTDQKKIDGLNRDVLPIYEPGLNKMVEENHRKGRLRFTTSLELASRDSDIHFITVGTPTGEDGAADLKYVLAVASALGRSMSKSYNVVVDKSTVPVGTADAVAAAIQAELDQRNCDVRFDVVSNPEFLKEGAAIADFMRPDRVIVGSDSKDAAKTMTDLYAPFMRNHEVILHMGLREAEMTKYTANALLATKISFMNEIAQLCEQVNVDVEQVRLGIGSDARIGYNFIYPGCGYGGSCFPKDVKALVHLAEENGVEPLVLKSIEARNERQKYRLSEKIFFRLGKNLQGVKIAIWGLSFKPGTDDMREAPSLVLIRELVAAGATIQAHDPIAITSAKMELDPSWLKSNKVGFDENQYEVLTGADVLVLVTEWKPFRNPDFEKIRSKLNMPLIFDGRNQYDPATMEALNIEYWAIGRGQQE